MSANVLGWLTGEIIDLEPACPMCGHRSALRMWKDDRGEGEEPCYLTWCGAHGVTAASRPDNPHRAYVAGFKVLRVKCAACSYTAPPHAFCRPDRGAV